MNRGTRIILSSVVLLASAARADTVFLRPSDAAGKPLEIDNVAIERVEAGHLIFQANGNETNRTLEQVQQIALDGEDALNSAEAAYSGGDFANAVDGYLRTFRSPSRPWLRDWVVPRMMDAANRAGRFDAAAAGYAYLLQTDAAAAAKSRPAFPAASSQYLVQGATDVQAMIDQPGATDSQKIALLGFLVDIQTARNDKAAADQAGDQLDELLAKDPANPGAQRALARRKLVAAQAALDQHNWPAAEAIIDQVRNQLADPAQQDDALWIIAQAKLGTLGDGKDPDAVKDTALAFMRIVADFKDLAGHPHVVDALLETARLEQRLGDTAAASELYRQVAEQYPDDPGAAAANASRAQLRGH